MNHNHNTIHYTTYVCVNIPYYLCYIHLSQISILLIQSNINFNTEICYLLYAIRNMWFTVTMWITLQQNKWSGENENGINHLRKWRQYLCKTFHSDGVGFYPSVENVDVVKVHSCQKIKFKQVFEMNTNRQLSVNSPSEEIRPLLSTSQEEEGTFLLSRENSNR